MNYKTISKQQRTEEKQKHEKQKKKCKICGTVYMGFYQKGSLMVPSSWDRQLSGICSSLPPIKPSSSSAPSSSFITTSLLPLFSFKPSLKSKKRGDGEGDVPFPPPQPLPTPSPPLLPPPPSPPAPPSSFSSLICWCSLRCCCS